MTAPVIPVEEDEAPCGYGNPDCSEEGRCRECSEEEAAERQADWIREEGW